MKKIILMSTLLSATFLCNEAGASGGVMDLLKRMNMQAIDKARANKAPAIRGAQQKQGQQQHHLPAFQAKLQAKLKGHKGQCLQKAKALHQAYQSAIKPILAEYKKRGITIDPAWTKLGHCM